MPNDSVIPIDADELAQITAALRATSYHEHLERYVRDRIAYLLDDDVTDPHVAMKRRGQVEELQHLLRPALCQTLALLGLRARAERDRVNTTPEEPLEAPPWWADPPDPASERPIP
jgi:ethanolamine ammonia-lyase large subunit